MNVCVSYTMQSFRLLVSKIYGLIMFLLTYFQLNIVVGKSKVKHIHNHAKSLSIRASASVCESGGAKEFELLILKFFIDRLLCIHHFSFISLELLASSPFKH